MFPSRMAALALLVGACLALTPCGARAEFSFTVTINSQVLVDKSADLAPYDAEFSFFGDTGNTITIDNFNLDGGAPLGMASVSGNASGDMGSSVTLFTDPNSGFFGGTFDQQFLAGSVFSFVVHSTTNLPPNGNPPDAFSFAILDRSGSALDTTAPDGSNSLVEYSIDGSAQIFAFDTNSPELGGPGDQLSPQVVPEATPAPEPASFVLAALGLVGMAGYVRRRRLA